VFEVGKAAAEYGEHQARLWLVVGPYIGNGLEVQFAVRFLGAKIFVSSLAVRGSPETENAPCALKSRTMDSATRCSPEMPPSHEHSSFIEHLSTKTRIPGYYAWTARTSLAKMMIRSRMDLVCVASSTAECRRPLVARVV
jgi:hypothetical protein